MTILGTLAKQSSKGYKGKQDQSTYESDEAIRVARAVCTGKQGEWTDESDEAIRVAKAVCTAARIALG